MDYTGNGYAAKEEMYLEASPGMRTSKAFLAALFIVVLVALAAVILSEKFGKEAVIEEIPDVPPEMLIFTSPADAEQQAEVRSIINYDWAVMLNTPADDELAIRAVPYLATLELETAIIQQELLDSSGKYVSAGTLERLKSGNDLAAVVGNLAVIEEDYYRLGLPSGASHAGRLRHLSRRLDIYSPPTGGISDRETMLFTQEHLGFSVDSYEDWYWLIGIKYNELVREMGKAAQPPVSEPEQAGGESNE